MTSRGYTFLQNQEIRNSKFIQQCYFWYNDVRFQELHVNSQRYTWLSKNVETSWSRRWFNLHTSLNISRTTQETKELYVAIPDHFKSSFK